MSYHYKPHQRTQPKLDDLIISSTALATQVAKTQEKRRILDILAREERRTNNSYITFDRLKHLIGAIHD